MHVLRFIIITIIQVFYSFHHIRNALDRSERKKKDNFVTDARQDGCFYILPF